MASRPPEISDLAVVQEPERIVAMLMARIADPPAESERARFAPEFGTRYLVTIDTEEEFDWNAPFRREGHTLGHVRQIARFQEFCERRGVSPVWLLDYPLAKSPLAREILRHAVAQKRAEVGIHLHPWVTPPDTEEVNDRNSFAGNLPAELEEAKCASIVKALAEGFGCEPHIFRAGRYGVGPATASLLRQQSVAIDSSVRARFDYSAGGGPDFRRHPAAPYWIGGRGGLLELPLTTVYSGSLRRFGDRLYDMVRQVPRLAGVLARLRLLERIPLTPEGTSADEARRGIDRALEERLPLLVFSFHSPSLEPGHTPYVRDQADLDRFYDWWEAVIAHCDARGVKPATVGEIIAAVEI